MRLSQELATSTDAFLSVSAVLQLKNDSNQKAKSTTQEEFEHNMWIINARLMCSINGNLEYPDPKHPPLFCYDNNAIQENARYARMGFPQHQRVHIPVHSPDFNKPIEHVFHIIKERLGQKIYNHVGSVDAKLLQKWVLEIFKSIRPSSIAKDVASLKRTYRAVSTDLGRQVDVAGGGTVIGTGGDWGAPRDC